MSKAMIETFKHLMGVVQQEQREDEAERQERIKHEGTNHLDDVDMTEITTPPPEH